MCVMYVFVSVPLKSWEGGRVDRQISVCVHVCVCVWGVCVCACAYECVCVWGEEGTLTLCIIKQVDWEHQAELSLCRGAE